MLNPEFLLDGSLAARIAKSPALDPIADAIQPAIRSARDRNPAVKSALAGTWIGHSLHPVLTDVPIGAFTVLAALDAAEVFGSDDMTKAADFTLGIAIASAYAAIVTGWADWSDTHDQPKRLGMAHAVANGVGIVAYQASLALRKSGRRSAGIAAAFVGYGFLGFGAFLGGELTTGMHLGVRHTATVLPPPDDFVDVASIDDVPSDTWLRVEAKGVPILLSRTNGTIDAIGAVCSHRGAPLEEGTREGDCIRCPWHGALFALEDGSVREGPATFGLPRFETRVAGGRIAVRAAG